MKGRLEEIGRCIDIRVGMPAAITGIRSAGFAIGLGDYPASVASLRRIGFIDLDDLGALPFRLVCDHVREFSERPGVQALVEALSVINLLTDAGQPTDGNGINAELIAPFHEIFGDQVQQVIDLARLFAFDLAVAA